MKAKLTLGLIFIAMALLLAAAWITHHFHIVKQRTDASHEALRKAAEFLQPDTHSDLRFGHQKPAHPTP